MAIGTTIRVSLDSSAVQRGFKKIKAGFAALSRGVKAAGRAMLAPFIKLMAVLAPLLGGAALLRGLKDIIDYGGAVSDMASRLGIAASEIVVIEEVFRRTGATGKDIATTLQRMGKNIEMGLELPSSEAGKALEALGVTNESLDGLNMAQQFELIGKKIGAMRNSTMQARASMGLFGREGAALVNTFKTGGAFEMARKSVGGLAGNMDKMANKLDHISDAIGSLGVKMRQFFAGMVSQMLPMLNQFADVLNRLDLTSIGENVGSFFSMIRGALGQGNLGKLIWDSFKYALLRVGDFLVGILNYAAEKFSNAVADGIAKTSLGEYLDIKAGTGARMSPQFYIEQAKGSLSTSARIERQDTIRKAEQESRTPGYAAWQKEQKAIKVLEKIARNTQASPAF